MIGSESLSSYLGSAEAMAIDFGDPEARGREQCGDIYTLREMLTAGVRDAIVQRVIRKVFEGSDEWGKEGDAVETSDRDRQEYAENSRETMHWYLGEGLSPAVVALEANELDRIELDIVCKIVKNRPQHVRRQDILRPSVVEILNSSMDPVAAKTFLSAISIFPVAALPQRRMPPAEIIRFMEERGITSTSPYYFSDRLT